MGKQILAAYGAGDLAWRCSGQRSEIGHGAVLTVYNDQDVDYTSYEGGTLAGTRSPGNGVIIATGPIPITRPIPSRCSRRGQVEATGAGSCDG
jgi:hypothetical protein